MRFRAMSKAGGVGLALSVVFALGGCSSELLESIQEDVARALEPQIPVIEV